MKCIVTDPCRNHTQIVSWKEIWKIHRSNNRENCGKIRKTTASKLKKLKSESCLRSQRLQESRVKDLTGADLSISKSPILLLSDVLLENKY